jgi:hypothetical protein
MRDFTQDTDFDSLQLDGMAPMHASEETLSFIRLFAQSYQSHFIL